MARPWYDAAKATFTALVDAKHAVSSAFQFVNVPMGIWIDERGRVVRPAEPAWTESRTDMIGGKPLVIEDVKRMCTMTSRDEIAIDIPAKKTRNCFDAA